MRLYVPACGQKLTLSKDWTFTLFFEYRNQTFINAIKPGAMKSAWGHDDQAIEATLPKGTVLTVARVYIRNGQQGKYDSLTFNCVQPGQKKAYRFWVKLDDVNQAEIEEPAK